MAATCAECSQSFEAKSRRAVYCSTKCRVRAHDKRKRQGQVIAIGSKAKAKPRPKPPAKEAPIQSDSELGPLESSLVASYKPADLQSPIGQIAMRLARDVDSLTAAMPGYSSLVAQYRAAADDLRSQAKPKTATPLTLLRERRAADRDSFRDVERTTG